MENANIVNSLIGILFLVVQFFIYKSKFKKYAEKDLPTNLKLGLDIVLLSVGGWISSIVIGFIFGLSIFISVALTGIIGILLPVLIIVAYYFILKFLASRHTQKVNAKKIADQTLVFTILLGILFYFAVTLIILPFII